MADIQAAQIDFRPGFLVLCVCVSFKRHKAHVTVMISFSQPRKYMAINPSDVVHESLSSPHLTIAKAINFYRTFQIVHRKAIISINKFESIEKL